MIYLHFLQSEVGSFVKTTEIFCISCIQSTVFTFKPWPNGRQIRSSYKRDASWTCVETCVRRPNGLASFLESTRKTQRKTSHFMADYPLFHWLIKGYWTSLKLLWLGLGGQTLKTCFLTCVQIWSRPKWVIASKQKCTQGLTKWRTCVYLACESVCSGLFNAGKRRNIFCRVRVVVCHFYDN